MYTEEQIKELVKTGEKKKIYDDHYWRMLAEDILKRDCYECQECKKEGKLTIKQHGKKLDIHHIKEIETHPELTYVKSNLLTVCVHHHNILDNKVLNKSTKQKLINEERW